MNWLLWVMAVLFGQTAVTIGVARPLYRHQRIVTAEKVAAWHDRRNNQGYRHEDFPTDNERDDLAIALLLGCFWPFTLLGLGCVAIAAGLKKAVTAGVPSTKEMNRR